MKTYNVGLRRYTRSIILYELFQRLLIWHLQTRFATKKIYTRKIIKTSKLVKLVLSSTTLKMNPFKMKYK